MHSGRQRMSYVNADGGSLLVFRACHHPAAGIAPVNLTLPDCCGEQDQEKSDNAEHEPKKE